MELVGSDGGAVRRLAGVTLFLKDSPAASQACGGKPGLRRHRQLERACPQLGASFVNDGTSPSDEHLSRPQRGAEASAYWTR